jgi:hypothetical protein
MGLSSRSACVRPAVRVPIDICIINGSTDPPAQRVNQSDATVFEAGSADLFVGVDPLAALTVLAALVG